MSQASVGPGALKVGYENNASNRLVRFALQRADGSWDLSGLLTRPCFEAWVATRRTLPQQLEVAFKDAVLTLIRERDCRTTLPPEMQSALLVELRKRRVWPCFQGYTDAAGKPITIGATGFRGKGQYEKRGSASPQSLARSVASETPQGEGEGASGATDSPRSEGEGEGEDKDEDEDEDKDDSPEMRHAMMALLDEQPQPLPQPPQPQLPLQQYQQRDLEHLQQHLQQLQHTQNMQHLQHPHTDCGDDTWTGYLEAEAARSKRSSTDVDLDTACEPAEYKRVTRAVSWSTSQATSELPVSQPFLDTACEPAEYKRVIRAVSWSTSQATSELPVSQPFSQAFVSTWAPYHDALTAELARAKQELHSNNDDPSYDLAYDLATHNLV
jgi:hypothetical protein